MRAVWIASLLLAVAAGWTALGPAGGATAQSANAAATDEDEWDGLPPGPGREEVFYACAACHSLAIVKQQGLSRDSWDESLDWMVEEQGMEELDPEERELILGYLSEVFGIDRAGRNP